MSQHPLAFWSLSTTDILRHCNFKWPRHSRITSRKRTQLHSACPVLPAQFPHVESESSVRERWEPRPGAALGKARPLRHVQLLSKAREATGSCARNWISCSIRLVHNCTALVMYLMH